MSSGSRGEKMSKKSAVVSGFGGTPDGRSHLERMIAGLKSPTKAENSEFLSLLSGGESLIIDALDGKEILSEASDVFTYIDSDFKNWSANERGKATKEAVVYVYDLVKDGIFAQFFGSVCADVEKLCFTQAQIKNFVVKHHNWLRKDGYATFFLFKSHGKFFVAHVDFYGGGRLEVRVFQLGHGRVWDADGRHRVVLLQLAV